MLAKKLGRKKAYRKSMLRNACTSLILYEKIKTTEAKSKIVKALVDKYIGLAKKNNLISYREMIAFFLDKNAVKKINEQLLPRYQTRKTGFVKSYKIKPRIGDGSKMVLLELIPGEIKQNVDKVKIGEKNKKLPVSQ